MQQFRTGLALKTVRCPCLSRLEIREARYFTPVALLERRFMGLVSQDSRYWREFALYDDE